MMSLPLLFALTAAQLSPFSAPFPVVQPLRIAMSPRIDGVAQEGEWDALGGGTGSPAFLQWEPGMLHLAAIVPPGQEGVFSIDLENDGWLNGRDNLEVRVAPGFGQARVSTRVLDGTLRGGPAWLNLPRLASDIHVSTGRVGASSLVEMSLVDASGELFNIREDARFAVRYDAVTPGQGDEPFLPRVQTEVRMVTFRAAGLPIGLRANVQEGFATVVPTEVFRTRFTFNGSNALDLFRLEVSSEGEAGPVTKSASMPFPTFDPKGRTFYDYETKVDRTAEPGYRVIRVTVSDRTSISAVIQSSFRIAPLVDFVPRTREIKSDPENRIVRIGYGVRSNSYNRVLGTVTVVPPAGWRVLTRDDRGFSISRKGFISDRVVELEVPGGTAGTFPLTFRTNFGEQVVEGRVFLTVR